MKLRAPRDDDFDAMLALMNAHQLAAYGEKDVTADELRTWLTAPTVDPARDVRVLEDDGRLIGYVDADKTNEDPPRWWSDLKVAPDADAGVVLPELFGWLDERAESGLLRVWTSADDRRLLDAFAKHGFEEARHSYRMEISLDGEPPAPSWPDGIAVRTFEPEDERTLYDVHIEVWQDTSDPWQESFEEWRHWLTKREGFDPSLWFLAFAADELAAYSLCEPDSVDPNAASGTGRGAPAPLVPRVPRARLHPRDARRRRVEPDRRDEALRTRRDDDLSRHGLPRPSRARVLGLLPAPVAVPVAVVAAVEVLVLALVVVSGVRGRHGGDGRCRCWRRLLLLRPWRDRGLRGSRALVLLPPLRRLTDVVLRALSRGLRGGGRARHGRGRAAAPARAA